MKIVGFNFTKINIEKISDNLKNLKINTNIDITDVKEVKSEIFKNKEVLMEIKFNYSISYEPKIAKILFSGNLMALMDEKKAKQFLKEWKKKGLPEENKVFLFNMILRKSNIKAVELEDELNLPLHISFPTIQGIRKE